jgi:hypothetical protein
MQPVSYPGRNRQRGADMEMSNPFVHRLTTDLQTFGYFLDALPLIKPQQRLRSVQTLSCGRMKRQLFQHLSFLRTEYKGSHSFTSSKLSDAMTHQICQRYF